MSRPGTRRALVAVAALLVSAAPLAARQTNEEIQARIDELVPVLEEARVAAQEAKLRRQMKEFRSRATVTDTFSVGPIRIVSLPEQRELATEIAGEALRDFLPWAADSEALANHHVTFQWAVDPQVIYMEGLHRRVEATRFKTRGTMEDEMRNAIGSILAGELTGTEVGQWFSGGIRLPGQSGQLYRELAGYPVAINQRCLAEGGEACWTAVGAAMDDTPYDEWYTAEERRRLVDRYYGGSVDRIRDEELRSRVTACLREDQDAACTGLMHDFWRSPNRMGPLGMASARPALLTLALQAGGEGAWARLKEAADQGPGPALQAASGLTPEELGDRWQAWVLEHRPESQAGLGSTLLLTLFWILAFAGLATRSSKWRLG